MPDSSSTNKRYVDIKVIDGGWNMDTGNQPEAASDLYSIAQDVKHRIVESGLARKLCAERNPTLRADVLVQIEQQAEKDQRIKPGSAYAQEISAGIVQLTAKTYDYDTTLDLEVSA